MNLTRNLEWLRAEVCRVLSVDPTAVDQAFAGTTDDPWGYIDTCITEALEEEIAEFDIDADLEQLLCSDTLAWASTARTLALPKHLTQVEIVRIDDETAVQPGDTLPIYSRSGSFEPEISWADYRTLQWGTGGPGENKTLRVFYIADPPVLTSPAAEPDFVPPKYRWAIVWGGAIAARLRQGESAPGGWYMQRQAWRERWHIAVSRGRPMDPNAPQQKANGTQRRFF
jgi:hypothetical protein